jgi:hypothetical protein
LSPLGLGVAFCAAELTNNDNDAHKIAKGISLFIDPNSDDFIASAPVSALELALNPPDVFIRFNLSTGFQ